MKLIRTSTIVLVAAAVGHAAPATAEPVPTANRAAIFLTIAEAKWEVRYRLRKNARQAGTYVSYAEVGPCRGYSNRRVRCFYYVQYGNRLTCNGRMEVIEFSNSHQTEGIGVRCS